MQLGEGEERELARELALDLVARVLGQTVPLVDRDDQRAAGFEDVAGDVRVLVRDVRLRVEQQDRRRWRPRSPAAS